MSVLSKIEDSFASAQKAGERFKAATSGVAAETRGAGKAAESAAPKLSKFTQSIMRVAKYRMIRSALRAVVDAVKEGSESFYNFSSAVGAPFAAAMDSVRASSTQMKNQVGAAFGELYTAIAPIILATIELLNRLANALTMIFAAFSGKGGWYKAKEGFEDIGDAAGGAGSAAKEALRYLAPFDELNRLPADNKSGGGGGGGNNGNFGDMYEFVPFEEGSMLDTVSKFVRDRLEAMDLLLDVFVFGVGAILFFSGANVPLGLGMMIVGGYKAYNDARTNWNAIKKQMKGPVSAVTAMISGGLVIGALLAFSGANIGLGLGLLVAGASGMAVAVSANWGTIKSKLQGPVGDAVAVISAATLVLGVLLCIGGLWGPGIGLIAAGAGGIATTVAVNWRAIPTLIDDLIFEVKKSLSLAVAWVDDYIGRGGAQIFINLANAIPKLLSKAWNGIVDDINEILGALPAKLKEFLGIPQDFLLEHVGEWKIIPDLDPPVGDLYKQEKAKWEEESRKRKMETMTVAEVDEFIDALPEESKRLAMEAKINKKSYANDKVKASLTVQQMTANIWKKTFNDDKVKTAMQVQSVTANIVKKTFGDDAIKNKMQTQQMTANIYKKTYNDDKVKNSMQTQNVTGNFVKRVLGENFSTSFGSTANFTARAVDTKTFSTSFNSTALFNKAVDGFGTNRPTIACRAEINSITPTYRSVGGVFSGGAWHNIPQYAEGTASAHGSMFVAGEAGPEVVGHIGGRTEVLNKSQLAATMYAAVRSAMSGINFHIGGMPSVGFDSTAMEEVMYSAFVRAMNDTESDETIVLDGDVLYRKMVDRNRAATYRMGSNPMMSMA